MRPLSLLHPNASVLGPHPYQRDVPQGGYDRVFNPFSATPVGWWALNQHTRFRNILGTAGDGSQTNSTIPVIEAAHGAIRCNGATSQQEVIVPHAPVLNALAQITISAWFYTVSIPVSFPVPICKAPVNASYTLVQDSGSTRWGFSANTGEGAVGNRTVYAPNNSIVLDRWQHVVCQYDGETTRIYIDGQWQNSNTEPSGNFDSTTGDVYFGSAGNGSGNRYNGFIRNVRMWSGGLSGYEIQLLYKYPWIGLEPLPLWAPIQAAAGGAYTYRIY